MLQQFLFQKAVFKKWIWSIGHSPKFIKQPYGRIALSDVDIQVKQQDIQKKNWVGQLKNVGFLELPSFKKLLSLGFALCDQQGKHKQGRMATSSTSLGKPRGWGRTQGELGI